MTIGAERRDVAALIAALTLDEKISLLDGQDFWRTQALERWGIPALLVSDGPHGLRTQAEGGDHLGLAASAPATCFPPAAGLASTWDVGLLGRVGEALGLECRAAGVSVLLGPGVNMKRSPLCGRNFEYFSEDPTLAGELAAALVGGLQAQGVGASVKHFAGNNQETDRMTVSADADERTLREIYLPAFEKVVTAAQPWTVMSSYNRVNGTYVSESDELLTGVLRDEWGFEGLVVSDWGGVARREVGLAAGLDLEMPSSSGNGAAKVRAALADGRISEADVDRAASRVLTLVARALEARERPVAPVDVDAHHALAREAATASAVLLKNEGGLLPLAAEGGPVAVVGEMARSPRYQGAGSSQVNPTRLDAALDALHDGLAGAREVVFAPGYVVESDTADLALVAEAVAAAAAAQDVVLFLGLPPSHESEGYDRTHLDLPAHQLDLLRAVVAANPRVAVVLSNGSVVEVASWIDAVPAVLEGWLLGQAGGSATADLLLGSAEPSGRLAETLPVRLEHNPSFGSFPGAEGHVTYGEGLLIGYRWYDTHRLPVAFPFGHGLGYTTFAYGDAEVTVVDAAEARVLVRVPVTNTGDRPGTETVQLYVADPVSAVPRPEQELRAFARVRLEPGETRVVELELGHRAFASWSVAGHRWVVEGGAFELRVGASSRDVRTTAVVELAGDAVVLPLAADTTAEEWFAHPEGGPWLRDALGDGDFAALLADPRNGQMMRAIPLQRLSRMPGFPVTEEDVDAAVERFGSADGTSVTAGPVPGVAS
jgi:beta-glucosidase